MIEIKIGDVIINKTFKNGDKKDKIVDMIDKNIYYTPFSRTNVFLSAFPKRNTLKKPFLTAYGMPYGHNDMFDDYRIFY